LIVAGTVEDLMARARAHPIIIVRLAGADSTAAASLLRQDSRVDRVEQNNGELQVVLHDPELHHHFIIEKLVASQIRIDSISPQQLKLEDVFLRLTKGIVQ